MLVSHAHQFMFFHIRKTGGTSIAKALNGVADDPYRDRHLRPSHVRERMPSEFKHYYKWSVVRNPWDRMVSCFSYDREVSRRFQPGGRFHGYDFAQYLNLRLLEQQGHWSSPQVDFIRDGEEWLVDFVARFEKLQYDFGIVCRAVGVKERELPRARKTDHAPYQEYYDDDTRQLVADVFARDIEAFAYTF